MAKSDKGAKSDANHPFILKGDFFEKLTDVNFVYFMYPITILQCLKKFHINPLHYWLSESFCLKILPIIQSFSYLLY